MPTMEKRAGATNGERRRAGAKRAHRRNRSRWWLWLKQVVRNSTSRSDVVGRFRRRRGGGAMTSGLERASGGERQCSGCVQGMTTARSRGDFCRWRDSSGARWR
ncbi:hypothetical protein U1Q18_043627 [Sarracenia purpurea var. burkii]